MAYFMGQDRYNFFLLQVLDQGIKKGYPLLLAKARKVSVGFGGAFGPVDYKNMLELKTHAFGIALYLGLQAARFQGGLPIEQRYDEFAVKEVDKNREQADHPPGIYPERRPGPFIQPDNDGQHPPSQQQHEPPPLELVEQEEFRAGLVETKFFLNHKSVVPGKRKGYQVGAYQDGPKKQHGLQDGMGSYTTYDPVYPFKAPQKQKGKGQQQ